jgi:alcohol dehydrogenase (cytochrome c)
MRILALSLLAALAAQAADVTADRLQKAENEPQNWLTYYGGYKSWRYSSLDQVSRSNVKRLAPVWAFESGFGDGGMQSAPLVVDGVMYVSTAGNHVFALDAATGEQIWRYDYELPDELPAVYGNWNRGVAIAYGFVYLGTLDNHLVAIDAGTGREAWNVEVESAKQCGCNITSAPLVVKDMIVTGVTGGDSAHRGYLNAFDAKTGRHRWRFWTIPGPGEPGNETWKGDSWKYGGGSTWITGTYDAELDLVYWGVGNPAADFYGEGRKGDNLYTESVVALDADTG